MIRFSTNVSQNLTLNFQNNSTFTSYKRNNRRIVKVFNRINFIRICIFLIHSQFFLDISIHFVQEYYITSIISNSNNVCEFHNPELSDFPSVKTLELSELFDRSNPTCFKKTRSIDSEFIKNSQTNQLITRFSHTFRSTSNKLIESCLNTP